MLPVGPLPEGVWNTDMLLKRYFEFATEPKKEIAESDLERSRLAVTLLHLRALKEIEAQVGTTMSNSWDCEMQGTLLRRKILSWRTLNVNKFPVEILQSIFRLTIIGDTPQGIILSRLRITWVCRHWRDIAINDPLMWRSINFSDPYPWVRSLTFLERSGTADIDVRVADATQLNDQRVDVAPKLRAEQIQFLLDKLAPKYHQLRVVQITLHTWPATIETLKFFSDPTRQHPRRLNHFDIRRPATRAEEPWLTPGFDSPQVRQPVTLLGGAAPMLTHLVLTGVPVNWFRMPLHSLTSLDLRRVPEALRPPSPVFTSMLLMTPNLRRLTLYNFGPRDLGVRPRVIPVELTMLRELSVGEGTGYALEWAFSHFTAPNLQILSLTNMFHEDSIDLLVFITGLFPRLRAISFTSVTLAQKGCYDFVQFIQSAPEVRSITLVGMPSYIVEWFTIDPRPVDSDCEDSEDEMEFDEDELDVPVVAPALEEAVFDRTDFRSVFVFARDRDDRRVPLKRICIGPNVPAEEPFTVDLQDLLTRVNKSSHHMDILRGVVSKVAQEIRAVMFA